MNRASRFTNARAEDDDTGDDALEINWLSIAKIAYEAYSQSTGNKNFRGEEMPTFEALPEAIRKAWVAAVSAACDAHSRAVMA